jgi:DNA-binding response OmpR family regulator
LCDEQRRALEMKHLIFMVEAEVGACRPAQHCLEQAGYGVRLLPAALAIKEAEQIRPSLLLVGAGLKDGSGPELCRNIRRHPALCNTPIILLPTGGEEGMAGLDAGADDCVSTPFSPRELVARVQGVLRRRANELTASDEAADFVIDRAAMKLSVRGNEVATTTLEFRLVDYLARHRGKVLTRDVLLDAVWGEMQFVTPRSVDACVRRVRRKIEPNNASPTYLKTVRRVGYRFDGRAAWSNSDQRCNCAACASPIAPPKRTDTAPLRKQKAVGRL